MILIALSLVGLVLYLVLLLEFGRINTPQFFIGLAICEMIVISVDLIAHA